MNDQAFQKYCMAALNPQQEAAVRCVEGPVLLLAVPGSGKTTVLVNRLGYMLRCCGIRPREVLTMTYTVAATRDMRARFSSLFGEELSRDLEFRTINGVSARIIGHFERTQGRAAFSLVQDEAALSRLVSELYRELTSEFPTDSDIKAVRTLITYAKNMCLPEDKLEELDTEGVAFAPIYRRYCQALIQRRWMDYDDQMVYAYKILRQYPEILSHFQERYRYLCVDEAQDTSKIQHMLIGLLAQRHRNLFMVGDEDQSIYGFRAAYPEALLRFEEDFPGASVLLLEKNYRSTPQIVETANRFIQLNRERRPKHMTTDNAAGPEIRPIRVYDRKAQYTYLAKVARDCDRETAVLYRDNDCALPVIDLLDRGGIGYRCRQLESGFFGHFIVRDIADIIRFAYDQKHTNLFLQLYYKFNAGISREAAYAAAGQSERDGRTVLNALQEQESLSQWSRSQVKGLQTHLENLQHEPAEKAVYRIAHFMGYGDYLDRRNADRNKVHILSALAAQTASPAELLPRLEELEALTRQGSSNSGSNFILSTIHSSKGLEYERVILMDVVDGILPKEPSSPEKQNETLEEERRLFYVAMSRAKRELAIFCYQKPELTSAFAQAVFPELPKPAPEAKARPQPKPGYRAPVEVSKAAAGVGPGTRMVHRTFGVGVVETKVGSIVTVRFENTDVKRIDLITALRGSLLKLE